MTTQYLLHESQADWLAARNLDITSTEASALFGLSPYETLFELWHRKNEGGGNGLDDNERMQAGRHIEPAIAALAAERYGIIVAPFKYYARDPIARMGSSFDYEIVGVSDTVPADTSLRDLYLAHGPGILECKNVDGLVFRRKWTDDETPAHIELQLQHQLEITGRGWGAIVALVGGNKLETYSRLREPTVGIAIRQAVSKFWRSIAANEAPPPVMPDDAEALIALNQFSDGTALDLRDDEWTAGIMAEYTAASATIKALEERQTVIKAQVLERAGPAGSILYAGGKVSATQTADNPGKPITPEMVGQIIGARKGYRQFRNTPSKKESA
jgi:putative phage-type endonuclease